MNKKIKLLLLEEYELIIISIVAVLFIITLVSMYLSI